MTARFEDIQATGTANFERADNLLLKDGSVTSDKVVTGANLDADKLEHRESFGTNFQLAIGDTVDSSEYIVFIAPAAGTVNSFKAKQNGANTTGTSSYDLKKNGSSILDSTVDITSSEGTDEQTGTLSSEDFVAGDVFSMELDGYGADGTGPFAYMEVDYDGS